MVKIKFYEEGLYEDVKKILQECDLYDSTWEDRENLKRKIERDSESILIAVDGEDLVGCVFIVEDGWNGFIWRLCVEKSHRRKGVGLMLMHKAEEIIKEGGIKESSIFIDPKNKALREWYENQKYIGTTDWTFMYKKLK